MNETPRNLQFALSRRSFVVGGIGAAIGVSFGGLAKAATLGDLSAKADKGLVANAWISIGSDGTVTIMSAASEMGQGIMTTLPVVVAEELDADWAKVRVVQSPANEKDYGNPNFGGTLTTVGSMSTNGYFGKLRLAGAQARRILILNAAKTWNVPATELTTEPGFVVHAASGRKLSYGEIAKTATVPDPMPEITKADLKPASQFRLIGKDIPRIDVPLKVNGTAIYGIDTHMPGMVYASIRNPDVQGETPLQVDDAAARKVKGFIKTVTLPNAVAVVADSFEHARKGAAALVIKWSETAKARSYSSEAVTADYLKIAADKSQTGAAMVKIGDAPAAIAGAAKVIEAEFTNDHVSHICMEPMNATAIVKGDQVEAWVSNQSPTNMKRGAAEAAGTTPDKVTIHTPLLGGGFGRRSDPDVLRGAVLIAKAMDGKPVKVIWPREDDVQKDMFRPMSGQRISIGLDADNNIVGWHHRIVNESYYARVNPVGFEKLGFKDIVSAGGGEFKYGLPAHLVESVHVKRGINVGAWRGIAPGFTKFAVETMIDEVAAKKGVDPLDFRISLLSKEPRGIAVLKAVAEMSNYSKARTGTAVGIAFSDALGSYTAAAVEVSLGKNGSLDVHHIWAAVDTGIAVQPKNIIAQMEGSMVFGLSAALYEQITIRDGVVQQTNLDSYRVPRMSDLPPMEIRIVATDNAPTGVGEAGTPVIAPAIANAVAKLTGGKRLRALPFTTDRVEKLLQA